MFCSNARTHTSLSWLLASLWLTTFLAIIRRCDWWKELDDLFFLPSNHLTRSKLTRSSIENPLLSQPVILVSRLQTATHMAKSVIHHNQLNAMVWVVVINCFAYQLTT
jgi:hypothetical protein